MNCLSAMSSYSPVVTSMDWPSARVTIAFLKSGRWPGRPRKRLVLPFCDQRIDRLHLDLEQRLDGRLDLRLGRVHGHQEDDLVVLGEQGRLLGDHRRRIMS